MTPCSWHSLKSRFALVDSRSAPGPRSARAHQRSRDPVASYDVGLGEGVTESLGLGLGVPLGAGESLGVGVALGVTESLGLGEGLGAGPSMVTVIGSKSTWFPYGWSGWYQQL